MTTFYHCSAVFCSRNNGNPCIQEFQQKIYSSKDFKDFASVMQILRNDQQKAACLESDFRVSSASYTFFARTFRQLFRFSMLLKRSGWFLPGPSWKLVRRVIAHAIWGTNHVWSTNGLLLHKYLLLFPSAVYLSV